MNAELIRQIDERLDGALVTMAQQDARTPALQLLWLARREAERRKLLPNRERVHKPQPPRRAAKENQP
ncbi:MAG: hypothetical protein B6D41_12285 [Chloroflexi bacterium UTCFX4]|jgi:hypothetical protein|nr:MAG: hypothetical protein B6D41_12285 [Chloroflexi bacterium UTCFX4]